MKILHVGKFFYPFRGGMENFLLDLVVDQNSRGMKPQVIAHHHRPYRITAKEAITDVPLRRVLSFGQFAYAPLSPTFGYHLRRATLEFDPDVIHAHLPNLSSAWALLLPSNIPLVIQWQSDVVRSQFDEKLSLLYPLYQVIEKKLLRQAQAVIVSSENYLLGSKILSEFKQKCVVVPLGLNPLRIHTPDREQILHVRRKFSRFLVLSAGRFTYYKGFDYLVKAAKYVSGTDFVIAGDGPLRKKTADLVKRLGLENRVFLPGELSDRELHTLMAACDVFCLPSIERTEAFGIVLLEAMTFAKPLITTNIEGSAVNWVNIDGETGLVVRAADAEDLAAAIDRLLIDPSGCSQLGQGAFRRLEQHFRIQKISDQIQNLYLTLQSLHAPN